MVAQTNELVGTYDRELGAARREAIEVGDVAKELQKELLAEQERSEAGDLAVAELKKELFVSRKAYTELKADRDAVIQELKNEIVRLRESRTKEIERRKEVTEKCQARLQKVKDHLAAIDRRKGAFLGINQLHGVLGFCGVLEKKYDIVVPPARLEKLKKLKAEKTAEYESITFCELTEDDLVMSPFIEPDQPETSQRAEIEVPLGVDQFGSNQPAVLGDQDV